MSDKCIEFNEFLKKIKMGKLDWEDFYHKVVRVPHNQFKSLEHLNGLYFQQLITLYLQNHRLSIEISEITYRK